MQTMLKLTDRDTETAFGAAGSGAIEPPEVDRAVEHYELFFLVEAKDSLGILARLEEIVDEEIRAASTAEHVEEVVVDEWKLYRPFDEHVPEWAHAKTRGSRGVVHVLATLRGPVIARRAATYERPSWARRVHA